MPNSVRNVMGAGMPALAAQMISGSIADGLTATGTTQAAGLPINTDTAVFTTVVAGNLAAVLPLTTLVQPGDEVVIANLGTSTLSVFPQPGGAINRLATDAAFTIGTGKVAHFIARAGLLNWVGILGA